MKTSPSKSLVLPYPLLTPSDVWALLPEWAQILVATLVVLSPTIVREAMR